MGNKKAVVLLAKCGSCHKTYGMRTEQRRKNKWAITWAFPIKESVAKHEGYDKVKVNGELIFDDNYPGCPYCGKSTWILCYNCGHFSCDIKKKGVFTCEWCETKSSSFDYNGQVSTQANPDF